MATTFDRQRAAVFGNCSGTRIGPRAESRHHRAPLRAEEGDNVRFYTSSNQPSFSRTVARVGIRPGTKWDDDDEDWTDLSGKFSDIAVVRLDEGIGGVYATTAWTYPGAGASGPKVGSGNHENNSALFGLLMRKDDETYSGNDNGGGFMTSEFALNDGDSGGACYAGNRLLGVTNGGLLIGVWRGRYTSVAEHLDWILDAINGEWSGNPVQSRVRSGTLVSVAFTGSLLRCQYARDRTPNCVAFNRQIPVSSRRTISSRRCRGSVRTRATEPAILVIAGPNGAGKTTLTERLRPQDPSIHWQTGSLQGIHPCRQARHDVDGHRHREVVTVKGERGLNADIVGSLGGAENLQRQEVGLHVCIDLGNER